jgi:8-amino-7-oxononanoate synthase
VPTPAEDLLADLAVQLQELDSQGLRRTLQEPTGIDFSSNDYLGLGNDPALRDAVLARLAALPPGSPLASPASRILRGTTRVHAELEERLAAFKGTEAALLFPSGWQANAALLTALLEPNDRALSDSLNHASLIDGLRLAGCVRVIVPHLDLHAIERDLAMPHPSGRTFLVTESLFSMDGDIAPLDVYADLAERRGACLIVDDAHATGVFGEARGSGLAEHFGIERRAVALVSTLGKALGFQGAFVAGPRLVIENLINHARPFVFTTAPSPLLLHAVGAALDLLEREPERRRRVLALADRLRGRLRAAGIMAVGEEGPIVPVMLGDDQRAAAVAEQVQRRGFDVRAVRPPTVPPKTARIRVSVHANHSEEQIDALADAIAAAVAAQP